MSLWLWIGLPLLFLLGLFLNAIKDMKQLEKQLPKYKDKIREVKDDEDDWPPRRGPSALLSPSPPPHYFALCRPPLPALKAPSIAPFRCAFPRGHSALTLLENCATNVKNCKTMHN